MIIERDKFYRTRGGRKIRIICVDRKDAYPVVGLNCCGLGEDVYTFCANGDHHINGDESSLDLIAPWIEKPDVDWSVLPAWHDSAAFDRICQRWVTGINLNHNEHGDVFGDNCLYIPPAYAPKWTGDWKDSLVTREVAK